MIQSSIPTFKGVTFKLTGMIIILIISSLLLAMTGSLTPSGSALLVLGGGITLFVSNFRLHQAKHQLIFRSHELGATSAIGVRHLGGLPFPIPTPVNVYFMVDTIRIETDHDVWQIARRQLLNLVIMSSDQIHKLPDQEIIRALSGGNSRLLSLVREKIRRGDSAIRHSKLVFLTILDETADGSTDELATEIVILSYVDSKKMKDVLAREDLDELITEFQTDTGVKM